jgi:HTH-type transcriptional regulator/antitoxin HipB
LLSMKEIGPIIKRHRKAAGLSQHELGDLAGVGKSVVFDMEKGKETVKVITLSKVLNSLNIKVVLEGPLIGDETR